MEKPELTAATAMLILTLFYLKAIYFWDATNALWEVDLQLPVSQDGQENIWFSPVKPNSG